MRFDAYGATVTHPEIVQDASPLADCLAAAVHGSVREADKGMHGYLSMLEVLDPDRRTVAARVLYGGRNGWPSVQVQGWHTPEVVQAVRADWDHLVTRVDSAEDVDGPTAWQTLSTDAIAFATEQGLKLGTSGDWIRGIDGRTLYVGSRKSATFMRLYEKGKQGSQKLVEGMSAFWVRAELQTRPQGAQRLAAAALSPEEVWGMAAWSAELASQWLHLDVERVSVDKWRQSDDERSFAFMVEQYGLMLARRAARDGWDLVARELERKVRVRSERE